MSPLRLPAAALAAGVALALGAGCATLGGPAMSLQEERRLGREAQTEVEQAMDISRDPVVVNYIRGIGQRLVTSNSLTQFDYTFDVVDAPQVNAFAIPGGHLYVNTGLVCAADTEAELAGVLGHEIGHAAERHAVRQMTAEQQTRAAALGGAALLGILLGQDPAQVSPAVAVPAELAAKGFLLKYSRDQEREADRLAVGYLHQAGYDPLAVASFFEELKAREAGEPGALAALLSSHPVTSDRIAATRAEAATYGPPPPRSGGPAGPPEQRLAEIQSHVGCDRARSGGGRGTRPDAGRDGAGAPGPA